MTQVTSGAAPATRSYAPTVRKVGLFALVGVSGLAVNTASLALLSGTLGLHYLPGVLLATLASTSWNFALNELVVFDAARGRAGRLRRLVWFGALNYAMFGLRGPILVLLVEVAGVHYLVGNLIGLLVAFGLRFAVADRLIWQRVAAVAPAARTAWEVAANPVPYAPPPEAPIGRARAWAAFVAVAAPSVIVRVWAIGAIGFNSDEAVYAGQGASLAGSADTLPYFPVFRAHPLLFQSILSVSYQLGGGHTTARLASAAFGLGTVGLVFLLGRELYGRRVGWVAALIVGLMPYHVVVARQVLLDGPMAFFATLNLWLLARFARTGEPVWLYASSGALGLAFLTKETSVVLAGGAYLFLALAPRVRTKLRSLVIAAGLMVVMMAPYPLAMRLSGRASTGEAFLTWQLFRRPNHPWSFYLLTVSPAIGLAVLGAAAVGMVALWRDRSWREALLGCWMVVPIVFFQLWPVKGFQYLLPVAAPLAVLAARALVFVPETRLTRARPGVARAITVAVTAVAALTLAVPTWARVDPAATGTFLAGSGGVPGGREAGAWIDANIPEGAELLAIGPSMANIVQFYGHRRAYGLSVSNNPLHRNPVYEPVPNPDLWLRHGVVQYMVWDSFTAARTPFFTDKLLQLTERYNGRIVHTESLTIGGVAKPVIVIYEVRP